MKQLKQFCTGKTILIADQAIEQLYAIDLARNLSAHLITIPSGEKAKSKETADQLIEQLFRLGCGRDTTLIALGGGVTTDLVGYVASTYMRGLPLILIPTTLLAMVDSSIGSKNGIDTPFGKNLIGTFYPPKAIFLDFSFLKSLPAQEQFNGLAEIWKLGLTYDASLWTPQPDIRKAIRAKIDIVQRDPLDRSLRRILNYGHTIGHALEVISDYHLPHGRAVAIGCQIEAHLSASLGYLPQDQFEQIASFYPRQSLPRQYTRQAFLRALALDKKKINGQTCFVLIDRIGRALAFNGTYLRPVTEAELIPTLDYMEQIHF